MKNKTFFLLIFLIGIISAQSLDSLYKFVEFHNERKGCTFYPLTRFPLPKGSFYPWYTGAYYYITVNPYGNIFYKINDTTYAVGTTYTTEKSVLYIAKILIWSDKEWEINREYIFISQDGIMADTIVQN